MDRRGRSDLVPTVRDAAAKDIAVTAEVGIEVTERTDAAELGAADNPAANLHVGRNLAGPTSQSTALDAFRGLDHTCGG